MVHRVATAAAVLLLCIMGTCVAAPVPSFTESEVMNLPGLDHLPNFRMYAGQLDGSFDWQATRTFFWLVESESNPAKDPLIVWYGAATACSSLDQLLHEHGPFRISDDGNTLTRNPHSWNKNANVLYLDNQPGVGFAFANDTEYPGTEILFPEFMEVTLVSFFQRFSHLRSNPVYFGAQANTAASLISMTDYVVGGARIRLDVRGLILHAPLLNAETNDNAVLRDFIHLGGIDDALRLRLNLYCNGQYHKNSYTSAACEAAVDEAAALVYGSGLNVYDYNTKCEKPAAAVPMDLSSAMLRGQARMAISEEVEGQWAKTCTNARGATLYLNREDVKQALHVRTDDVVTPKHLEPFTVRWAVCSRNASLFNAEVTDDLQYRLKKMVEETGIRVLMYHGETDLVISARGGRKMAEYFASTPVPARFWSVDGQIAGVVKEYSRGMVYVMVMGAGQTMARTHGAQTQHMLHSFLHEQPM